MARKKQTACAVEEPEKKNAADSAPTMDNTPVIESAEVEAEKIAPSKAMPKTNSASPREVDLLALPEATASAQSLEQVRLGEDDVFMIPFTSKSLEVPVHYCDEKEIGGYVVCNGEGCVLCRIGKRRDMRILLPVYAPTERRVVVLPMSLSFRPGALMPQILNVMKSGVRSVVIVRRHNARYEVVTKGVPDGTDDGAAQIRTFTKEYEAGRIDLSAGYQRIDNESLARCEQIAQKLRYHGVTDDKGGRN